MFPCPCPRLNIEEVGFNRYTACEWYGHCLDIAVRGNWPGWHCRECPVFGERAHELIPSAMAFLAAWLRSSGMDDDNIERELEVAAVAESIRRGAFSPAAATGSEVYRLRKDPMAERVEPDGLFAESWEPDGPLELDMLPTG